jgi:Zn-finger nucleic acid-binding protein
MVLSCAVCRQALVEVEVRGVRALGCPGCDGHWLEPAALAALMVEGAPGKALDHLVEFEDGSERHACPVCSEELESVWLELIRFERCSGHGHGFWAERTPLGLLLAGPPEPPPPRASVMPGGRYRGW